MFTAPQVGIKQNLVGINFVDSHGSKQFGSSSVCVVSYISVHGLYEKHIISRPSILFF